MNESTHILLNGESLYVSPNLMAIFKFIVGIEEEVLEVIQVDVKLDGIRDQFLELLDLCMYQSTLLKENSISYSFDFKEDPKEIAEKLNKKLSIRSQSIVLFAYLETLRVLWTAYELKTFDELVLKNASNSSIDKFIKEFCLNNRNEWFKKNSKRSGQIGVKSLRDLRNNLTHFFSVSKLGLVYSYEDIHDDLRKGTNNTVQFISPTDIYEMIKSAARIMLEVWSNDFKRNGSEFKERIYFVNELVRMKGANIIDS